MKRADLNKLCRILNLLGSDQAGERASAGLAAHRLITGLGLIWADVLEPTAPLAKPKIVVQRVSDYDVDQRAAAEARMRQLKASNERLEKEIRALRRRLATIADQKRRQREREEAQSDA